MKIKAILFFLFSNFFVSNSHLKDKINTQKNGKKKKIGKKKSQNNKSTKRKKIKENKKEVEEINLENENIKAIIKKSLDEEREKKLNTLAERFNTKIESIQQDAFHKLKNESNEKKENEQIEQAIKESLKTAALSSKKNIPEPNNQQMIEKAQELFSDIFKSQEYKDLKNKQLVDGLQRIHEENSYQNKENFESLLDYIITEINKLRINTIKKNEWLTVIKKLKESFESNKNSWIRIFEKINKKKPKPFLEIEEIEKQKKNNSDQLKKLHNEKEKETELIKQAIKKSIQESKKKALDKLIENISPKIKSIEENAFSTFKKANQEEKELEQAIKQSELDNINQKNKEKEEEELLQKVIENSIQEEKKKYNNNNNNNNNINEKNKETDFAKEVDWGEIKKNQAIYQKINELNNIITNKNINLDKKISNIDVLVKNITSKEVLIKILSILENDQNKEQYNETIEKIKKKILTKEN
jgi:exonuclease SbcC